MTIILDAMGSDNYPHPEILGALEACENSGEDIILVGDKEIIEPELSRLNRNGLPVSIQHASEILKMDEKVVESSRKKPDNSMSVGLKLVKEGRGKAFVSAGSTGAVMFNALRQLGRLPNVNRPALTTVFPVRNGYCVVLDIGANADCRPEFLAQFAIFGSVYAEKVLNVSNPRVGLLSNGEEAGKGNQLIKDAYPLLEKSGTNFIGNVESKEVFAGETDVVVTDGFTGNVMLKTSEAVAKLLVDILKTELMSSVQLKIGALLAKKAFINLKRSLDPDEIGAAALLGIDGLVLIGHGRSDAKAIASAIRTAQKSIQSNVIETLNIALQKK